MMQATCASSPFSPHVSHFPLRGIDTDRGSGFLNGELMVYCEQHLLTFTRRRSGPRMIKRMWNNAFLYSQF